MFSRWLDSPPGLREWKNPTFIAYVFVLLQIPFHGFELPDYKERSLLTLSGGNQRLKGG